ncbi:hypothetical protein GPECTOR_74g685 [Gonium pectorale]|uniref:Protein kinase domain-containing protein n=1 Tax=Gonium pectorale TaxID=33097 RepID=A0A150G2Q3_GONPE|nr:hypothetical protein GPECTOR_74g685 [Gonium pectorale]|eukprot:KXZ44071.1 hypothetical protein GPECTOR_74g685 [Gonium pectorale]
MSRLAFLALVACVAFPLAAGGQPSAPFSGVDPAGPAGAVVECRTGAALAAALANTSVSTALIPADMGMAEADWAPYRTPVLLQRTFTVLGTRDAMIDWPELDLAFLKAKVLLGPGSLLNFSRVVLVRSRNVPPFQPVGMDLLASSSSSPATNTSGLRPGIVASWGAVNMWRTCLPAAQYDYLVRTWSRPPAIPGTQLVNTSASLPVGACVNNSRRLVKRCWPAVGLNVDAAVDGLDTDANDKTVPNGYLIWAVDFYYLCETQMTDACVAEWGPAGCYVRTMAGILDGSGLHPDQPSPLMLLAPIPPEIAASAAVGSGRKGPLLAPLLAGVLGARLALPSPLRLMREELALVPVTPLTPFAPDIDLTVETTLSQTDCTSSVTDGGDNAGGGTGSSASIGGSADPTNKGSARSAGGTSGSAICPCSGSVAGVSSVELSHRVLGKGAFGRVVVGMYMGVRVAVKLLNMGLLGEGLGVPAGMLEPQTFQAEAAPEAEVEAGEEARGKTALEAEVEAEVEAAEEGRGGRGRAEAEAMGKAPAAGAAAKLAHGGGDGAEVEMALPPAEADLQPPVSPFEQHPAAAAAPDGATTPWPPAARAVALPLPQRGARAARLGDIFMRIGEDSVPAVAATGANAAVRMAGVGIAAAIAVQGPSAAPLVVLEQPNRKPPVVAAPALRALAQEVEVLARCRHPNVVRLFAANLGPPRVCLVMELMDTSLERLLHGGGDDGAPGALLPLPKVLHIALQVARALAYLHPTILHRDLKPANVLVSQADSTAPVAKLADFGLARLRDTVLITRHPEVGTDIWAFGVILWEMLSGERPWGGLLAVQIACAIKVSGRRLPLESLPPERCPPKLRALLTACWEQDPSRRPAAAEVVKTLALAQEVCS